MGWEKDIKISTLSFISTSLLDFHIRLLFDPFIGFVLSGHFVDLRLLSILSNSSAIRSANVEIASGLFSISRCWLTRFSYAAVELSLSITLFSMHDFVTFSSTSSQHATSATSTLPQVVRSRTHTSSVKHLLSP